LLDHDAAPPRGAAYRLGGGPGDRRAGRRAVRPECPGTGAGRLADVAALPAYPPLSPVAAKPGHAARPGDRPDGGAVAQQPGRQSPTDSAVPAASGDQRGTLAVGVFRPARSAAAFPCALNRLAASTWHPPRR